MLPRCRVEDMREKTRDKQDQATEHISALQRLTRLLRIAESAWAVALYSDMSICQTVINALQNELLPMPAIVLDVGTTRINLSNYLREISKRNEVTIVCLYNFRPLDFGEFGTSLDLRREGLRREKHRLVFWLTPDELKELSMYAPNFMSRVNTIVHFLGSSTPIKPAFVQETISPLTRTAPPIPGLIVGRDGDIAQLKQRIYNAQSSQQAGALNVLTAIRGWPGIGKTTLAVALAHDSDIAARFPDGVLWASLGQQPNLLSELASWARELGIPNYNAVKTAEELSQLLADELQAKRFLLIVDDVWEVSHLLPFRIGGPECSLLVTTRLPEIARAIAPNPDNVYALSVLDETAALKLLRSLAPSVVATNDIECRELIRDLEGLPLALQIAGRLLQAEADNGFAVGDLLLRIREGGAVIMARAPVDRADIANQTTPTVAALLDLSTNRLDELDLTHFAYLGAFAPKPATFDIEAIRAVWEVDDPKPSLNVLLDRGLLEVVNGRYWIHALLVAHARSFWSE